MKNCAELGFVLELALGSVDILFAICCFFLFSL